MEKKVLILFLVLFMVVNLVSGTASAAYTATGTMTNLYTDVEINGGTAPTSGYYSISSEVELKYLASYVNDGKETSGVTFYLANDIDLNSGITFNSNGSFSGGTPTPWTPIGTSATAFAGTFDGNNHTIGGLYFKTSGGTYSGLFGNNSGTVMNASVANSCIWFSGTKAVLSGPIGGMAGNNTGTITNCYNAGSIIGMGNVGGIAGCNTGTVTNCYNIGSISASNINNSVIYVGGVVGKSAGTITNCYNVGTVKGGGDYISGVAGKNTGTITNCYNTGIIIGRVYGQANNSQYVGGVTGCNDTGGSVFNCYNVGNVSGSGSNFGGVAGSTLGTVSSCFYDRQMCTVGGINGADATGQAEGKLTTEMTGLALKNILGTETNWTFSEYLYPRLANMDTTDAAYVSTAPLTLVSTIPDTVNAVTSNFSVCGLNSVKWYNSTSIFDATTKITDTSTVSVVPGGTTLTAKLDNVSKTIMLKGTLDATVTVIELPACTMTASTLNEFAAQISDYVTVPAAQTVTITNTGNQAITLTEPATTNAASNYEIGPLSTTTLAVSGTATFTVQPKTGLAIGGYTETIHIAGTNSAATSVSAQFTVNPVPAYTMTASALTTFDSQTVGYASAPAAQTVTITNIGNQAITLTEPATTNAASNYDIGALSTTTLAVNGTATFTVQPKTGLAVGGYTETINITGTNSAATSVSAQFTVNAVIYSGGSHTHTQPENNGNASVIVNDQVFTMGHAEDSTEDGKTVTKVIVDPDKLESILETQDQNASVVIHVTSESDVASGVLTGQMVKNMEAHGATLEIQTPSATYTLPASEINVDAVSEQFGASVALKDIVVGIQIAEPSDKTVTVVESAAMAGAFSIVVPAVEFTINCTYSGHSVSVSSFNAYVERTIAIPDGVDPTKITTGVVVNSDGTVRHVPTKITVIDGKYYADINSLTNSTYAVIWNPIEFTDVKNHWAKDAINNMGSRIVISGVGDNNYEPNREITRAEFAAIVVRALGLAPETKKSSFDDVSASAWYCGYIETAAAYGIITGYNKTTFGPNDEITREQAMTMIARAMKITGLNATLPEKEMVTLLESYTDSSNASDYARSSIAACLKTGVLTGKSSITVAPKDNITRAEVAVIVQRLLKNSELI